MEPSSALVPFPLLVEPVESTYQPCTIPYRFPSDDPRKATATELEWIDVFRRSIPSFRKRAEEDDSVADAPEKAKKFEQRYTEILEDLVADPGSHGGPPDGILLCRLREQILRELGFRDIFRKVKDEENAKAIALFEGVCRLNDAIEDENRRVENLIRGIFSGNVFDLGSAQLAEMYAKDGISFLACCENLLPRPWIIDDLDTFISKWSTKSWKKVSSMFMLDSSNRCARIDIDCNTPKFNPGLKISRNLQGFIKRIIMYLECNGPLGGKTLIGWLHVLSLLAVIFVDNSGADIILGILPFARELLRRGTQVVLAANDLPSINDITYHELVETILKLKDKNGQILGVDASSLLVANSGNDLPVIDLSLVSPELAYLASDADLVIIEGMGRGIETNLHAQFKCDALKIGMVKHPEVAEFLGGRLYDCVFKYTEVSS